MSTAWRLGLLCFAASQVKTQQDFSGTPGGGVRLQSWAISVLLQCRPITNPSKDVQSLQGFEGRKRDFEGCLWEFSDSNPVRILTFNSFWRFSWPAALSEEKLAALEPLVEAARVIQSQGPSQILLKQSSSRNVKSWARVTQSHWGYKPSSLPKSVPVDDEESLHLVFGKHWIEAVPLLRCRWCIYGQTIQHEAKTRSNKSIIATQTTSYHSFIWIQHMIR